MTTLFRYSLLSLALCLGLASCDGKGQGNSPSDGQSVESRSRKSTTVPKKVTIYLYDDFPIKTAAALKAQLSMYFPEVEIAPQRLQLPQEHFHQQRNRYNGSGLLKDLSKHRNNDAVIGLTDRIIYKANEISPTFGIMGLSPMGTYICLVSSKIPKSGKLHSEDNFVKLALHELGHAYGLPHCPDQKCYMVDAEHKMKFPHTTGFCQSCTDFLTSKAWKVD